MKGGMLVSRGCCHSRVESMSTHLSYVATSDGLSTYDDRSE